MRALLALDHYGAALTRAVTAIEMSIRFFLVTPLLQGAFFSDDWADLLMGRIIPKGMRATQAERELLPQLLLDGG